MKISLKSKKKITLKQWAKDQIDTLIEGKQPKHITKCVNLLVFKMPNRDWQEF